jgi:zinc transport system substrate-binding protein
MPKMKYVFIAILAVVIVAMGLTGCGTQVNSGQSVSSKVKVITTIYPVYEFTQRVGGDKVEVTMLVPPGAEPHDWEPTVNDLMQIKTAKLFLYHGAGMEPVAKLLTKDVLGNAKAVEVSKNISLLSLDEDHEEAEEQQGSNSQAHEHEHGDTHVWLDPVYAQQEVKQIAEALADVDPQNREYYRNNAVQYNQELAQLDAEYKKGLSGTTRRDIITSHAAFGYLAKRYNLQQVGIMGLSPDSEPTPERMGKVVMFCREHNVKYIFFETMVSPKLAETIAKETGAGLLVLNPVESLSAEEVKQGKNYLIIMRENLVNLQKALQ